MKTLEILKLDTFNNAKDTDFSIESEVKALKEAISSFKANLGKEYPVIIGGEKIYTEDKITSINPGKKDQIVGYMSKANLEMVDKAINTAVNAFATWKLVPAAERAEYLFKAAELFGKKRHEFSAALIIESGKNYEEADAEVSEAIDFLNFYGRSMNQLEEDNHHLKNIPNEKNRLKYIPLGVGFIVPPWNFPLAITVGLTVSAVVTGNTTLLKPASNTSIIAYKFVELMEEVGLPAGVINFIPGDSSVIGDYITGHQFTRFISFTGSKDVGLRINEIAGKTAEGQKWIKRVNAEMGGKDGIVVDETADLDFAASEIIQSAFTFQGQKCSAGSRLIIVEDVYDELIQKVVQLAQEIKVGNGEENYFVGPVIDEKAYNRILEYIEIGKKESKLVLGGTKGSEEGYYINPTIFIDADPNSTLMQEEIFGPVLTVAKAKDWEEAIEIYNNTDYGLTGSFFSKDESRIEQAIERMYCGNLYVNRRCTGALVGVHPFGGFNFSGTDSKAGGYDYLKLFSQGKTHTVRQN
ncbi:L-glutamate gamma-semialdehyde dehydrogenase [Schinkia azotoformans]|uniref:L-glutamate gamma-semialdehyde dehydrogenase n=1 Tax=Schinkia azotoformans TaxID=1454 RepID=UPI002DB67D71|nr:L-glutamate gamma-semialdehyde dehydrogenase [Schinkia azotoformans]MEC1719013.1 L-glutamate gamma-semialdehyde dehydrogenase [Schinkia azotoformans]MED4352235.1 L-glutamate gamma-semialdehyde dehydrogenase [Schinkia azotoformans]MED4411957.1 L-glutamate gamma-semialdehyde dehydrogenase [Schinkia azotoformans]